MEVGRKEEDWAEVKGAVEPLLGCIRFPLLSLAQLDALRGRPLVPQDALRDAYAYKAFLMAHPLYDGSTPPFSDGFRRTRIPRRARDTPAVSLPFLLPPAMRREVVVGEVVGFMCHSFVWRIFDMPSLFPPSHPESASAAAAAIASPAFVDLISGPCTSLSPKSCELLRFNLLI